MAPRTSTPRPFLEACRKVPAKNRKTVAELPAYLTLPHNPIVIRSAPAHVCRDPKVTLTLYAGSAMPYNTGTNRAMQCTYNTIQCNTPLDHRQTKTRYRALQGKTKHNTGPYNPRQSHMTVQIQIQSAATQENTQYRAVKCNAKQNQIQSAAMQDSLR